MRVTSEAALWRRWLASASMTEREARVVVRCRLRDWRTPSELGAAAWVADVDQALAPVMPNGGGGLGDTAVVEGLVRRFQLQVPSRGV